MTNDWGPDTSANMGKKKEIWGQIDAMNDADFVTLSIGGNDAGFFEVLNACLFKFYGPAAPSCEKTRKRALHRIKSQKFNSTYNAMLDSILERHPASSFRIFANGYSRFFDDALTSECNHISLGYWTGFQPRLTVELRRSLNELCDLLNERIGLIIQERNDERVIWVNWAPRFNQHRLCRPGKGLLDGESWFYGVGFRGRSSDPIEGDDCDSAGDFESRALCDIAIAFANHPQMEPVSEDFQVTWGREFFGPKYARVFHPTPDGYKAIVDQILEVCPYASAATVLGANINTEE